MVIKNKYLVGILKKIFRIETLKLEFIFVNELYDKNVTKLAFLNQSLDNFDELVEVFRDEVQMAIKEETK